MAAPRSWWYLLPRPIRRLPADLAAVAVLTLLTMGVVFVPVVNETPLRIGFGLAFVLFLPGYAFIAALFPEEGESPTSATAEPATGAPTPDDGGPAPEPGTSAADAARDAADGADADGVLGGRVDRSGIDGIERVALSFGLSIAIVPLLGLLLNFTPWGIRLVPVVLAVAGFTLACTAAAAHRRWELPPEERFAVPYDEWIAAARAELFDPADRVDAALNVVLALSVLLAVGSVAYAVAVPPEGEQFSEFYVLTEDDDGELVADGYPQELAVGEPTELVVGIGNQEHEPVEYTVVIQLQAVEIEGNESTVLEREELDRFSATLEHNETHHADRSLAPTFVGEELRIQFLLYAGDVPAEPTRENAYRDLHLWVDVREADAE